MELEGEDGSKLELNTDSDTVFGRGLGLNTEDKTVSRRHVIFHSNEDPERESDCSVSFTVTGKNPIWVRRNGEEKIEVFRNSVSGDVAEGDWFCVSSQNPVWFCLKSVNLEALDVSKIDPVKEFGFLVIGHEFDSYNKHRIRGVKNWDWFIEDDIRSDDDDDSSGGGEKKRKKSGRSGNEEDDEDWSGENEEDKEVVWKKEVGVRPKYSTRSKEASAVKKDVKRKKRAPKEEEEETLGGLIVGDENEGEEGSLEEEEEEEEEEEFEDDD